MVDMSGLRAQRKIVTGVLALLLVAGMVTLGSSAAWAGHPGEGGRPLHATLSGDNEVPEADPDGSGSAHIRLNQGQEEVCFAIEVSDIMPATAAHIHVGAAGVNGPVVVGLAPPDASGTSSGCVQDVDKDLIKDIRQNPSNYYVNVHNAEFPGGAVRGQLTK